jgi:hypothetical protein
MKQKKTFRATLIRHWMGQKLDVSSTRRRFAGRAAKAERESEWPHT